MKQGTTSQKHGGISLPNSDNQEANREGKEVSKDKTYFFQTWGELFLQRIPRFCSSCPFLVVHLVVNPFIEDPENSWSSHLPTISQIGFYIFNKGTFEKVIYILKPVAFSERPHVWFCFLEVASTSFSYCFP